MAFRLLSVGLFIVLFLTWWLFRQYQGLQRNIAVAKRSSIPYIVVPVYGFSRLWLTFWRLIVPPLRRLPTSWTASWIEFIEPEWIWKLQYDVFRRLGSDVILVVSPVKSVVWVADAQAVTQIVNRRTDFPKPIHLYGALDIFGKNVVSAEGSYWRHHRRITAPPFSENSNRLVWSESLAQAQSMLSGWQGRTCKTIQDVAIDTMRLSLHVISRAGFGVRIHWPHEAEGEATKLPKNHSMSYRDALGTLLENLIMVMLIPETILAWSPFKFQRTAHESFIEWRKYMRELYQTKVEEIRSGSVTGEMDLMGALVGGAGAAENNDKNVTDGGQTKSKTSAQMLSDTEVLGNAFVFILAGHETTANTIHFALLFLALNRRAQESTQKDILNLVGDLPIEQWTYDQDLPKLNGSMVGAVMNETLRLIPPVIGIPKSTLKGSPQNLVVDGRNVTVPDDVQVELAASAIHRNPKYWPNGNDDGGKPQADEDVKEFKPERWFNKLSSTETSGPSESSQVEAEETNDFGGPQGQDTSPYLYRPPKGAFIPFSEGARSCLGRRFAQVEIVAVLAVILRHHTVELAVDNFASDEEVAEMPKSGAARQEIWQKAADRAQDLLVNGMESLITIQMRKGNVPVRLVPKGEERFPYIR